MPPWYTLLTLVLIAPSAIMNALALYQHIQKLKSANKS